MDLTVITLGCAPGGTEFTPQLPHCEVEKSPLWSSLWTNLKCFVSLRCQWATLPCSQSRGLKKHLEGGDVWLQVEGTASSAASPVASSRFLMEMSSSLHLECVSRHHASVAASPQLSVTLAGILLFWHKWNQLVLMTDDQRGALEQREALLWANESVHVRDKLLSVCCRRFDQKLQKIAF